MSSGVATGWNGMDMSTPVFPEVDFPISQNPQKNLWGVGGSWADQIDFDFRTGIKATVKKGAA